MVFYNSGLVLIAFMLVGSNAWDLSHLGIRNYSVLHVTIFKNNAYLSLKIFDKDKIIRPTLVEASWPENDKFHLKARAFPSKEFHKSSNKNNYCKAMQQVVSTELDIYGKLWVLDEGNSFCEGKLIVINIFTLGIAQIFHFNDKELKLSSLSVDSKIHHNPRAYIGVSNANILIVCQYHQQICIEYIVEENSNHYDNATNHGLISTENTAVSQQDDVLYVTSNKYLPLFQIPLDLIRRDHQKNNIIAINANYIGDKLGPSKGLFSDAANGLTYFLSRDYAVVRWDTRKPLSAEGHRVLKQSYQLLPDVSQFFSDPYGTVWAVTSQSEATDNSHFSKKPFKSIFTKHIIPTTCVSIYKLPNA